MQRPAKTPTKSQQLVRSATSLMTGSQNEFAYELGVSPAALRHWLAGRRNPSPEHLDAIAGSIRDQANRLRSVATMIARHGQTLRTESPTDTIERNKAGLSASRQVR